MILCALMGVTFPASANQRGEREVDVALRCDGSVPMSLRGSVFGVAPTGDRNPNTPFLNGDPLFYRIDFSGGAARTSGTSVRSTIATC